MTKIIAIRPLSVNEGYRGTRYKTDDHKVWERSVMWLLPHDFKPPTGSLQIYLKFGFSSKASDFDNCIKFFTDCLSKKYGFNDKLIRRAVIETEIVPKGKEFIEWDLTEL